MRNIDKWTIIYLLKSLDAFKDLIPGTDIYEQLPLLETLKFAFTTKKLRDTRVYHKKIVTESNSYYDVIDKRIAESL